VNGNFDSVHLVSSAYRESVAVFNVLRRDTSSGNIVHSNVEIGCSRGVIAAGTAPHSHPGNRDCVQRIPTSCLTWRCDPRVTDGKKTPRNELNRGSHTAFDRMRQYCLLRVSQGLAGRSRVLLRKLVWCGCLSVNNKTCQHLTPSTHSPTIWRLQSMDTVESAHYGSIVKYRSMGGRSAT